MYFGHYFIYIYIGMYLGYHLQYLGLRVGGRQDPEGLQATKTPSNLPLLLLQTEVAVGNEGLVPLHLVWGSSVSLGAALHHPTMLELLANQRGE